MDGVFSALLVESSIPSTAMILGPYGIVFLLKSSRSLEITIVALVAMTLVASLPMNLSRNGLKFLNTVCK